MISNLDVWLLTSSNVRPGTGNQDMYNTVLGYARNGWEVHLLTDSRAVRGLPKIHDSVFCHRKPIRLLDAQQAVKRWLRSLLGEGGAARSVRPHRPAPGMARYMKVFRWAMSRRGVALARRLGPVDLVYGYEFFGAAAGRAVADALGVPLVTRFQGTELCRWLGDPAALLADSVKAGATRTPADLVIMANDGTQGDRVLDALGVPREKVRFWMNGVDKQDVFRPQVDAGAVRRSLGIDPGEVFILHTGRLFHWKRIDRHLEVLARVRRQFEGFRAVFIGDGPEREAVLALCTSLGLDDRVRFLGAMPHGQVMDYLNACDIYISFYDLSNLSNSLIESCVCGKCIVTTAVGGTGDLVTDGANAVVVPEHDDPDRIAAGLLRVLRDPGERARLAEGARCRGCELLTWQERMQMEVAEVEKVLVGRTPA